MLPAIKNADGTDRSIRAIPEPNESAYDLYPNLRSEFIRFTDPKYSNLTLKDIGKDSHLKAEFKCKTCSHKWIAILKNRTKNNTGCPYCCKYKISFPEKYIYYCLKQVDSNLQENYKLYGTKTEFDMYDSALKLAIEFNSGYSHVNKQDLDNNKIQYALSQNIRLIRVWQILSEKQVSKLNKDEYIVPDKNSVNIVPDLNIIIDDICQQYSLN